jgi:hypothetical protein
MHWKFISHLPLDHIVIHAQIDAYKELYIHISSFDCAIF